MTPASVKRVLAGATVVTLLLAAGSGIAQAGREQSGNVIASLSGRIAPRSLPRLQAAPTTVSLSSKFYTDDRALLPQLRRIAIAISSRGRISAAGLPICRASRIRATTPVQALAACRGAVVGHGRMLADAAIPGQKPVPVSGRMMLFNGRLENGEPAMLADVHMKAPPASFVMPFAIRRDPEASKIVLSARLPRSAGSWARIRQIDMSLGRRYRFQGQRRSFVSASCLAPPGFTGTVFPLAFATYSFAGGRSITTSANSTCKVRK